MTTEAVGKEISLAQHEYNISPKKKGQKRPHFPEDDEEAGNLFTFGSKSTCMTKKEGKGMTKWYCLCAFIWLAVIGMAAYVVPTFVLNRSKDANLAPLSPPSPTRSPAPIVTRKPTRENPGGSGGDGLVDGNDTEAPQVTPVPSASVPATKTPTRLPTPFPSSVVTTPSPTINSNGNPTASPKTGTPTASPTKLPVAEPSALPSFSPHPVRDYIVSIALEGGEEFKDPETYQSKALAWLMTQELPSNPIVDVLSRQYSPKLAYLSLEQEVTQLYALACWYYNTNGVANLATNEFWLPNLPAGTTKLPGWFDEDGWLSSASTVCSEWFGIGCNQDGLVEAIVMNDNLMSGKIPNEIGFLKDSLRYMDVRENYLANIGYGEYNFFNYLTNVQIMKLGFNYFSYDGIPPQLGAMTSLVDLDISYMLWYGQLKPGVFQPMQNLEYLAMGGNEYNSALPDDLVQLPKLKFLYAEFTNIQGNFDFIGKLTGIEEIWIDQNPITGTIPTTIGNLASMESLSFTLCQISGQIPTTVGNLAMLRQTWMSNNDLSGTIPAEFANLANLERLHLQGNDLNGAMPAGICEERFPFGRLTYLQADCDGLGNVDCGQGDCCTCCGPSCPDF
mmetsp:Transcript_35656/g.86316  ORF Transcript_35656/g.86316 Transcript_35656/m.86316 type:complete len:617 (-) Transcript_35656:1504-3354(-)|eukprot:CAMPEP_0113634548 /NCGR_PEP_ID=MMETSP0017_2-20120614/17996_1 /TAXON_ID=2856 /ORGANISM="Cylindrotheca closterium" /LENGTH=616 /DNA_ID=CAMNT_0000545265 /DNA_START=246 /DNA_END=2096 /DNA_ORIENTATION=- /assembly_acc=CAM_ASM_000147